jgi:hypothetical protein
MLRLQVNFFYLYKKKVLAIIYNLTSYTVAPIFSYYDKEINDSK